MWISPKLELLLALGFAEQPHSGTTLLMHLLGTAALLLEWGQPQHVCDAGLFHSLYGTTHNGFLTAACARQREVVRHLLGDASEALVWTYSRLDREAFYLDLLTGTQRLGVRLLDTQSELTLDATTHLELSHLLAANWLEQSARRRALTGHGGAPVLAALGARLCPSARAAIERALDGPC